MATLTEGKHDGEFIGELAMGIGYHVDLGTLISGQNHSAGTVVGKISASGKYTILAPAAVTGEQAAAGITYANANASAADLTTRFMLRGPAIVNGNDLVWPGGITAPQKATAIAQLLALGIKVV